MIRSSLFAVTVMVSAPVSADVAEAVSDHILPGLAAFAEASAALDEAAEADCRAETLRPAFHDAFDAWIAIGDLRIGPLETGALSVAFWPDNRGFTPRTLSRLIAEEDPIAGDPAAYAEVSIAARGLFALERLLYDPAYSDYAPGTYTCALVQVIATDLDAQASALQADWTGAFAQVLITAGAAENATYLSEDEAIRALYTQLLASLEFTENARLAQPMGTFERPRPKLAEAWRSERSLRNVVLSVEAAQALATALYDSELPQTDAAAAKVQEAAGRISDPSFQDIEDPQARLKVEVLQQAVRAMHEALEVEIGAALGIAPGFNSQDGD